MKHEERTMTIQERIQSRLVAGIDCQHLEIENESSQHNVPPGSESHFRVVIVSADFSGKALVARHQMVYRILTEEMAGPVHALALHTYTETEWCDRQGDSPQSPPCHGGGSRA